MTFRKTQWVLAAATGLTLGTFAIAQQAGGGEGGARGSGQQAAAEAQGEQGSAQETQSRIEQAYERFAQDPQTAGDKLFLLNSALHNRFEARLAQQVSEKTTNQQVKQLAQQQIQHLQQEQQQLRQTAQALGVQLPDQPIPISQREIRVLSVLPPEQLDKQYVAYVQAENARGLTRYQSEAQIAQNPQVKQFVEQQIPWMRQQEQQTNQTAQAVGITMGGEAQPAGGALPGHQQQGEQK